MSYTNIQWEILIDLCSFGGFVANSIESARSRSNERE